MLEEFLTYFQSGSSLTYKLHHLSIKFCRTRPNNNLISSSINHLPLLVVNDHENKVAQYLNTSFSLSQFTTLKSLHLCGEFSNITPSFF